MVMLISNVISFKWRKFNCLYLLDEFYSSSFEMKLIKYQIWMIVLFNNSDKKHQHQMMMVIILFNKYLCRFNFNLVNNSFCLLLANVQIGSLLFFVKNIRDVDYFVAYNYFLKVNKNLKMIQKKIEKGINTSNLKFSFMFLFWSIFLVQDFSSLGKVAKFVNLTNPVLVK